ncbi:MAG: CHAT domain-containing protein, partial [Urechidicola sp.]
DGSTQASMRALVNPDLGNRKMDLAGAEKEATAIVDSAKNARLLLSANATETVVKTSGRDHRSLNFVSHGVFDDASPLKLSLLVADKTNDGRLTVSEFYGLQLNADLVIAIGLRDGSWTGL